MKCREKMLDSVYFLNSIVAEIIAKPCNTEF